MYDLTQVEDELIGTFVKSLIPEEKIMLRTLIYRAVYTVVRTKDREDVECNVEELLASFGIE